MSEQDTATINQIQPRWRNDKASIQLPKIHPISSQGYRQDIIRMLLGDSWDVARIQPGCNQDPARTLPANSLDTA